MDRAIGLVYTPRRVMGLDVTKAGRGLVLLLAGTLAGCALFSSSDRVMHQQGRTTIQLERDPSAGETFTAGGNTHPVSIQPAHVASILRGIQIRSEHGMLGAILSLAAPAEAVFIEEEVAALAPLLADGLAQAAPSERVGFTYWSAKPGRRNRPLLGSLAVREPYLRFGLTEHPTVGWQDPQDPSAPTLYELEFAQRSMLSPGTEEERKAGRKTRPLLQINYRRYLAVAPDPSGSASPITEPSRMTPAGTDAPLIPQPLGQQKTIALENPALKDLQRQVKELTESNQELRAKLKDALARQESARTVHEELAGLRRELADLKQVLADKVLELHRIQGRSSGPSK